MKLSSPSELKNIISKHSFTFSKSLGQNFLIDENVLSAIVENSGIEEEMAVLEIGPGAGVLTCALASVAKKVVAVEIDKKLLPILAETLSEFPNAEVINEDIMETDLKKLFNDKFDGMKVCVVANLPYYITTPVIMKLLESELDISSITVMIQKEVASRISARPGTKDYGALSVAVQFYCDTKLIATAPPSCFIPQPKVSSSVIRMDVCSEPKVNVKDKDFYFKVVKSAFGQRRKTLLNALSNSPYISIKKDEINQILNKLGFKENLRGETLSIYDFAKLSDELCLIK